MPYIDVKTNISTDKTMKESLKTELTKALENSFPGKTERWLMLNFTSDCEMYFAGSDKPCMMVDISIFGSQSDKNYDKMTAAVCELVESVCKIPQDRVYVKYSEYTHWGFGGSNF